MKIKITTIEKSYIDFSVDEILYRMYREDFESGKFEKLFGSYHTRHGQAVRGKKRQAVTNMIQKMVQNSVTIAYIQ